MVSRFDVIVKSYDIDILGFPFLDGKYEMEKLLTYLIVE